jgi:hypothetical protein
MAHMKTKTLGLTLAFCFLEGAFVSPLILTWGRGG